MNVNDSSLNHRCVRVYPFVVCIALLTCNFSWSSNVQSLMQSVVAGAYIQSITCPEHLLVPPDGLDYDHFGISVDIEGDTAVVGAFWHTINGATHAGAAYVYTKDGGAWSYAGKLTASDYGEDDRFGMSVGVSGDTIAVGDPGGYGKCGKICIFERPSGGWGDATENARLSLAGAPASSLLGESVDIDRDTIVAGDFETDFYSEIRIGEAYVFVKPATGWIDATQDAILTASDAEEGNEFGVSVAVKGDTIVVGAPGSNGVTASTGAAYVYQEPAGGWSDTTETAKLTASDGQAYDRCGESVGIDGNLIALGASADDPTGSTYLYIEPTGGWTNTFENVKLTPSDTLDDIFFGGSVCVEGDRIYIGAHSDGEAIILCGAVYYYDKPVGGWTTMPETAKIIPSYGTPLSRIGSSVSSDGENLLTGAANYFQGAVMTGAAYIFEVSEPVSGAVLSLLPTDLDVYRCEEREITVHLSEADGVVGYRIVLNYDPVQVTYVSGSATITGTDCEGGWFGGIVNDASPGQVIFTSASLGGPFPAGPATLVKFTFKVNCVLPDFEAIDITFDETLTNLNDGAIAVTNEPWAGEVNGPNIPPSFTPGSDINILEDFGPYSSLWATDITSGTDYEDAYQSVWFEITSNSNPGLFGVAPAIDAAGILTFTPADDAFGSAELEIVLHDDGGTANGGSDVSPAHTLTIIVTPVNDPPSFTILNATAVALNESVGLETILNFASNVSPGPANESSQDILFSVGVDHTELFAVEPAINSAGTMVFGPAAGAHGVANATVILQDNGGTDNGGVDLFGPQTFVIKIYLPYQWGELSADGIVGAVDAWNALLYYVGLIDEFPAYPPADYPEYYPGGVASSTKFPPAGDVNWDGVLAALDASLILQQFALLIDYFPADLNQDDWGPDAFYPGDSVFQWAKRAGARRASYDPRRLIASVEPTWEGWRVSFSLDRAEDVLGFRVGLKYNPNCLSVDKNAIQLGRKDGLLVINDSQPGALILSSAFLKEFPDGMHELLDLEFIQLKDAEFDEAFVITIDPSLTNVNDGHIDLDPACLKPFNLDEFN